MRTKTLEILFGLVILSTIIVFTAISVLERSERDIEFGGFKEITGSAGIGTAQSFEISDDYAIKQEPTKTTDRYDEKYLEYLDSVKESRGDTFIR